MNVATAAAPSGVSVKLLSVQAHCLVPYVRPAATVVDEIVRDIRKDSEFRTKYHAFTCVRYHARHKRLFCGTTNFGNDLLQSFDPETGRFQSMRYQDFGEPYEIKIHRALDLGDDGMLYGATSSLHDVDERQTAPGGKVFRFDPATRTFQCLCIPKPHDYIQTTTLDSARRMIYGMTYPVFDFFAYSIAQQKVVYRQFMRSITHIGAVDDAGGYWGTWGGGHRFFRYDPATNDVTFFRHGLPSGCHSIMYAGAGPIDCMINGHDGYLYIGGEQGELFRLDPRNAEVVYLGRPVPSNRMPGLVLGPEGLIFGVAGNDDRTTLFTYNRQNGAFAILGRVRDEQGQTCFRPHDLCWVGNCLFVGETDNPRRTCYLWQCQVDF
jgi:hypothetical protein